MQTENKIESLVQKYFDGGFNCAESVLLIGAEIFDHQDANIPRIATPFGGGLAGNGYTCGAISGGLMVIGLRYGRQTAPELEQKRKAYELADRLLVDFEEHFDCLDCRSLSGINFKTEEGVKTYKEHVHTNVCVPIVEFVATWLEKNL